MNVKRRDWKLYGNVLIEPDKAVRTGVVLSKDARDPGNTEDTTVLRPGLIVALAEDGKVYEYGKNFKANEETFSGDGETTEFTLENSRLVPYSETVRLGSSLLERGVDYTVDYKRGVLVFFAAPANGASVKITYLYDEVRDGTEIPLGVLEDYAYLKDETGTPEDTNEIIVIGGYVNETELKAVRGGLEWAKAYLSKHGFFGITDPEYTL